MQQGRPDAAAVVGIGAAGGNAFPAQPGVGRPLRRQVPFVLRVHGIAPAGRAQVLAEIGEQGQAVLQGVAPFVATMRLGLDACHQAVLAGEAARQLGAQRGGGLAVVDIVVQRAAGESGDELLAPAAVGRAHLPDAGARLDPAAVGQHLGADRVQPGQREAALAAARARLVRSRRRADGLFEPARTPARAFAVDQQGHQRQRRAAFAAPLQTAAGMDVPAPVVHVVGLALCQRERLGGQLACLGGDERVASKMLACGGDREVVGQLFAQAVVAGPGEARTQRAVLDIGGELEVVQALAKPFAGDDVDGAGDRPRAGLGGRRAQDLDPLDLLGRQRIDREPRRDAFAVEQDLRIARPQPAHADRAAAAGPALHRHAGQALQQIADRAVAEALDLVAADHDLGSGRLAPLLRVVGPGRGDFDRLQGGGGGRGGGLRRRWRLGSQQAGRQAAQRGEREGTC